MNNLIMLKWGGSLITEKDKPLTARKKVIYSLAQQLKRFRENNPEVRVLLGHGSGSFGHSVANQYKTRSGVFSKEDWIGFSKVWLAARQLNIIVSDILQDVGLESITFPPSTFIQTSGGIADSFFEQPLKDTLKNNQLLPVVHGDVVFDNAIGGTILSTEDIFLLLAKKFKPQKILLAGIEPNVWQDYPQKQIPVKKITRHNYDFLKKSIEGSSSTDVTGGMLEKTRLMLELVQEQPDLTICIFSGLGENSLCDAFTGGITGTTIEVE